MFPGGSAAGVLTDASVRLAMRRAGIDASPHGFRSTFRTWAQARGENWEASELSLGHRVGSSVSSSLRPIRHAGAASGVVGSLRGGRRIVTEHSADNPE